MHLLIPFAAPDLPHGRDALQLPDLPNLQALLGALSPAPIVHWPAGDLAMPHERVKARLMGLPASAQGDIPWAALAAAGTGHAADDTAWAWISPVHLIVGSDNIKLVDPALLDLQESESRELLHAMQPYFNQDGIGLEYESPRRWLAQAPLFNGLACASLDRAAGQDIRPWMPGLPTLRRLQSEMQMLLYTHPLNDARQARAAMAVNSFWIHGSGRLPAGTVVLPAGDLVEATGLRQPALQQDATAWQQAWRETDATQCLALRELLADRTQQATLTVCGTRASASFGPQRRGLAQRLYARLRPVRLAQLLESL